MWNDRLSNLQPRRRLTVTVARICKKGLCRDKPGEYIHFGKVPQLIDRRFATCRPLLESLVGRRHANEENAAVIRNLHRGGAESRAGGSDNSSVPEAEYPSREDAPVADTAASSRRRRRRAWRLNLAYPPEWRLPTTDIKPRARSKCLS